MPHKICPALVFIAAATALSGCGDDKKGGTPLASSLNSVVPANFKSDAITQEQVSAKAKLAGTTVGEIQSAFGLTEFSGSLSGQHPYALSLLHAEKDDLASTSSYDKIKVGDACGAAMDSLGSGGVSIDDIADSVKEYTTQLAAIEKDKLPAGLKSVPPKDPRASVAYVFSESGTAVGGKEGQQTPVEVTIGLGATGNQVFLHTSATQGTGFTATYAALLDGDKKTLAVEVGVDMSVATGEGASASTMKMAVQANSVLDAIAKKIHSDTNLAMSMGTTARVAVVGTSDLAKKSDDELSLATLMKFDIFGKDDAGKDISEKKTINLNGTLTRKNGKCTVTAWTPAKA